MLFPFDQEILLEDDVALLRPLAEEDAELLLEVAIEDPQLLRYSPFPIHRREFLEEYIRRALAYRVAGQRYTFSVYDKRKQAYAGSTSFLNISNGDDRLEIGATWYGRLFQRTGLNRHCKFLMLQYAFEHLGAMRVEFRTDERNQASRRAIEGIGACYEGLFRSHTLMFDGFRRNTVCYSILAAEWEKLRGNFPGMSKIEFEE